MAIGQLSKPFTSVFLYGKEFDIKAIIQAGGFPSSHSSVWPLQPLFSSVPLELLIFNTMGGFYCHSHKSCLHFAVDRLQWLVQHSLALRGKNKIIKLCQLGVWFMPFLSVSS